MNLIQQLEAEAIEQFSEPRPSPNSARATRCASASRWSKASAPASRISKASASPAPIAAWAAPSPSARSASARASSASSRFIRRTSSSIEVVRRGAVRRAKLYYLRGRTGKSARIAERRDTRHLDKAKAEGRRRGGDRRGLSLRQRKAERAVAAAAAFFCAGFAPSVVMPARAGIPFSSRLRKGREIPAFAGMTGIYLRYILTLSIKRYILAYLR